MRRLTEKRNEVHEHSEPITGMYRIIFGTKQSNCVKYTRTYSFGGKAIHDENLEIR